MPLSQDIVDRIRDEIGPNVPGGDDFDDASPTTAGNFGNLEDIYTNANRGNLSILRTALICWRLRLSAHQNHAFDAAREGNWLARSQKSRFLRERVDDYERLLKDKPKGQNTQKRSAADIEGLVVSLPSDS